MFTDIAKWFSPLPKIERPIFIWSAPRSGASLFYRLLARHPLIGCPVDRAGNPVDGSAIWWSAFGERHGAIPPEVVNPERVASIYRQYGSILRESGGTRLADMNSRFLCWLELIDRLFPDAFHVHIVRDGRAVLNSILYTLRHGTRPEDRDYRENKRFPGPVPPNLHDPFAMHPAARHAMQWAYCIQRGVAAQQYYGRRCFETSYEDLVSNPRFTMSIFCMHAELRTSKEYFDTIPPAFPNRSATWYGGDPMAVNEKDPLARKPVTGEEARGFDAPATPTCAIQEEDLPYMEVMVPYLNVLGYLGAPQSSVEENAPGAESGEQPPESAESSGPSPKQSPDQPSDKPADAE